MADSKHTPGPWMLDPCGDVLGNRNTKDDNGMVCTMCRDRNDEEGVSNARLIAAAPDLLHALRQMVANAEADGKTYRSCYNQAVAAITKAEGR